MSVRGHDAMKVSDIGVTVLDPYIPRLLLPQAIRVPCSLVCPEPQALVSRVQGLRSRAF